MIERIWTVSNLLSILRIILVFPISVLLWQNNLDYRWLIVGLIIFAALTDLFDGVIARKLNQVTEFGKVIDPLADKIGIIVITLILFIQGKLPFWFLMIVLSRDILIFAGGIYIKQKRQITLQSNWTGKWTVAVISFLILVKVLSYSEMYWIEVIFLFLGTIMLIASFVVYLQRFIIEIRKS